MKPEQEDTAAESEDGSTVAGDVIGDTAYSQRFVLKNLLKLANLDTLKEEIKEKSFEDDLCTLWDMTTERDVVLFLLKHDVLNLFNFAVPVLDSPRITEIIVGIIGNMCCQKETVTTLLKMDNFLSLLLENIKTDDSLILIQLLRLTSSCLFLAESDDVGIWINKFESINYSEYLYFILKNSSNKDLLVTALENFNTLSTCCNIEMYRTVYFNQFVTLDALESLCTAFIEVADIQKDQCDREELERVLVISLQITMNLVGFDKSYEMFSDIKHSVINMINVILSYYENKLIEQKEIDTDMVDILESSNTIISILKISEVAKMEDYFEPSYSMWKALTAIVKSEKNGVSSFEEEDSMDIGKFADQIKTPLSILICHFVAHCADEDLMKALDKIGKDYEDIIGSNNNKELCASVSARANSYRTRLKDNVDS